jgi:uncharacterized protein (DUF2345 family)
MNKKEVQKRVLQNGKPLALNKFSWDEKTKTFSTNENNVLADFSGIDHVTLTAGGWSTLTAGDNSTLTAGGYSTLRAGNGCTLTAGWQGTLTAGGWSTLTAEDNSTLTAGWQSTLTAGGWSTLTAEDDSTLTARGYCTLKAGNGCTLTAEDNSTLTAGDNSTLRAGWYCTLTAGDDSTLTSLWNSTLTAGGYSTLRAGWYCTLTAGDDMTLGATGCYCTLKAWDDSTITAYALSKIYCEGENIVIHNRNVFEAITPKKGDVIQICPLGIKGHLVNGLYNDEPHIIADGILSKIISKKKNIYKVVYHGQSKCSYIAEQDGVYSHGKTIKQAQEDLIYKICDRDTSKYEDMTLDSEITFEEAIAMYRSITGACSDGCKYFVEQNPDLKKDKYTIAELIKLTNGQYQNEKLKEFFKGV